MRPLAALLAAMAIVGLVLADARGQDRHEGHAQHHDVYKNWRIPGTASSCCNEKKMLPSGETTGDCYPTRAATGMSLEPDTIGKLVWWVLTDYGQWIEIPDNRIVNEANPDETGEAAHLCQSLVDGAVLCFRPPNTGT